MLLARKKPESGRSGPPSRLTKESNSFRSTFQPILSNASRGARPTLRASAPATATSEAFLVRLFKD